MFVREGVQTAGFSEAFPKPSGPLPAFGGILCSASRAVSKPTYFLLYQSSFYAAPRLGERLQVLF